MRRHVYFAFSAFFMSIACGGIGETLFTSSSGTSSGGGGSGATGAGGSGGTGGGNLVTVIRNGFYWGPETKSMVLTTQAEVRKIDNGITLQVCKSEGTFGDDVDVQLWWYDPTTKERGIFLQWMAVKTANSCTEALDAGTNIPVGQWMEPRIILPSGMSKDGCPNEQVCSGVMPPEDNTYRSTAFKLTASMPNSNQSGLQSGCFWGPEVGSPVLTTEAQMHKADGGVDLRVCKCEGGFVNSVLDLELWSLDIASQEHAQHQKWSAVSAVNTSCTQWLDAGILSAGLWFEPRIISPSGSSEDDCPNEQVCANAMQTLPDNTYRSTSFRLEPAN